MSFRNRCNSILCTARRCPTGHCACWDQTLCQAPPEPRLALLKACLRANRKNLIERFPPFLALVNFADQCATLEHIVWASDAFLQDLATWFHLAWMGETVRRSDPRIGALSSQASGFFTRAASPAAGSDRRVGERPYSPLSSASGVRAV